MNKEQFIELLKPHSYRYISSDDPLTLDSITKVSFSGNEIYNFCEQYAQSKTESLKKEIEDLKQQRFKKPETKQLIDMAILFNEGVLDKEKLADMLAYAEFIVDRLHDNGDILIPSKNED